MKFLRIYLMTGILVFFLLVSSKLTDAQVVINEISSSTDHDDWIEIYAYEDVDLTNYRLTHLKSDGTEGDISIPSPTSIGPSSSNGSYKVIEVNNYLGNSGDRVRLYLTGNSTAISDTPYGDQGGVCTPSLTGSIARIPNGGNTVDRLSTSTKGITNGETITDPCPSPTPIPTNTPTNTPAPTNTPVPNTPTPTAKPTVAPTIKPTSKPTAVPKDYTAENEKLRKEADVSEFRYDASNEEIDKGVLGATSDEKVNEISPFAYVLLGLGVVSIGISVFFFVKNKKTTGQ